MEGQSGKPAVHFANRLVCSPGETFGPRIIEDHQFIYVERGRGAASILGREYAAEAGQLFYYGPGEPHRFQADPIDPFVVYGLHFLPCEEQAQRKQYRIIPVNDLLGVRMIEHSQPRLPLFPACCKPGTWLRAYFEEAVREFRKGDGASGSILSGLLLQMLGRMERFHSAQSEEYAHQHEIMEAVRNRLEERAGDPYDLTWLRRWTPYGHDYASRLFRRLYGVSPHVYHMRSKLDKAAQLLQETDESVTAIAGRLHFAGIHYFSRTFKAYKGVSPRMYRDRHRWL